MAWVRWAVVTVVVYLFVACGSEAQDTGGETNWLHCERDDDCTGGGSCNEGTCVPAATAVLDGSVLVSSDGSASMSLPLWLGNEPGCPVDKPTARASCDVVEGQVCAYWTNSANGSNQWFDACACFADSATTLAWYCFREYSDFACPREQPRHGEACWGFKGQACSYPSRVDCECPRNGEEPSWSCHIRDYREANPPEMDLSTPVADLSPEQQLAWCEWFADPNGEQAGFPERPLEEPTADGYYPTNGCINFDSGLFFAPGWMPTDLPVGACVDNLALSTCEMPLEALTDCARTAMIHLPQPHGCAAYLQSPGCSGTIVIGRSGQDRPDADVAGELENCQVLVR
ncbi:MAG TPA: hypothetical protein VHO25_20960 [Polyangiaceae bacterium]|nr:hypothetical protein [Polyangiaceae bacterium]